MDRDEGESEQNFTCEMGKDRNLSKHRIFENVLLQELCDRSEPVGNANDLCNISDVDEEETFREATIPVSKVSPLFSVLLSFDFGTFH